MKNKKCIPKTGIRKTVAFNAVLKCAGLVRSFVNNTRMMFPRRRQFIWQKREQVVRLLKQEISLVSTHDETEKRKRVMNPFHAAHSFYPTLLVVLFLLMDYNVRNHGQDRKDPSNDIKVPLVQTKHVRNNSKQLPQQFIPFVSVLWKPVQWVCTDADPRTTSMSSSSFCSASSRLSGRCTKGGFKKRRQVNRKNTMLFIRAEKYVR